jgi:hypothetical protein
MRFKTILLRAPIIHAAIFRLASSYFLLVFQSVRLWLMLRTSLFHISSPTKGSFSYCHFLHIHAYAADSNNVFPVPSPQYPNTATRLGGFYA